MRVRTILALFLAFGLLVAACGVDDDAGEDDAAGESTGTDAGTAEGEGDAGATDAETDGETGGETGGDVDSSGSADGAYAEVVVDGITYTGATEVQCLTMGGYVVVQMTTADGASIEVSAPPAGTEGETASLRVSADDHLWVSGEEDVTGTAVVGDYTIDGTTVTGTATLIDVMGSAEPVSGTFSGGCPAS